MWKKIDFLSHYSVSDTGEVRNDKNGKILKQELHWKGYLRVNIYTNGKCKHFRVHRLVLSTFNPIINMDDLTVDHLDGDKKNNKLENLEWCTVKENIRRYWRKLKC